ncbi:hypothetical protein K438DRAFT_1829533 [Mycena galopus ATCC 62051]|nr:hypothetical protein K438DRAFT_1829533 [Mycena galopus ATCC 62051]
MVELPQELIDKIIQYVSISSDVHRHHLFCSGTSCSGISRANLKACALVCSTFLAPSQRCLFGSLNLRGQTDAVTGLAQRPHLSSYVRDLHIDLGPKTDSVLGTILPLFTGVCRLVLALRRQPRSTTLFGSPWTVGPFSDSLRIALLPLFHLPTLCCLGLLNCRDVPASFIRTAFLSCKEVALQNIHIYEDSSPQHPEGKAFLDRLILRFPSKDGALLHLIMHGAPSLLEVDTHYLELLVQAQKSLGGQWMDGAGAFLRTLVVNFRDSLDHPIDLPTLPGVRSLKLRASTFTLQLPFAICSTIAHLPAHMPNLEMLAVVVDATFAADPKTPRYYAQMKDGLKELPYLREVHFRTSFQCAEKLDVDVETHFNRSVRASLSGACPLTFSKRCWCRRIHPMRHFSNQYNT